MKCSVCRQENRWLNDHGLCEDCRDALRYLMHYYNEWEIPQICKRLGSLQEYLISQLGYNLPATAIAAVLVLEEKGRQYEM